MNPVKQLCLNLAHHFPESIEAGKNQVKKAFDNSMERINQKIADAIKKDLQEIGQDEQFIKQQELWFEQALANSSESISECLLTKMRKDIGLDNPPEDVYEFVQQILLNTNNLEDKLSELENQQANRKREQERLILKVKAIHTFLQTATLTALRKSLLCPYTQQPLEDAIFVKTNDNSTFCTNASYLGLKKVNNELKDDDSMHLSKEAQTIKEQMLSKCIDYTISQLATLAFREDISHPIDLEHDLLQDPVFLEPFENAHILDCGHSLSERSIHMIRNNQCAVCRHPIDKVKTVSHPILNRIVEILGPDFEKELKSHKEQLEHLKDSSLEEEDAQLEIEALKTAITSEKELLEDMNENLKLTTLQTS